MNRRQQAALLLASLVLWTFGNAIMGIWPLYAVALGASPAATGNFLALGFLGMAAGTLSTGWLLSRWQRPRALFLATILLGIPAALIMARATAVWQLAAGTTMAFTAAGVSLALFNISTGQHAGAHERGRIFGLLALMMALGAVLGNLVAGPVADRWGYPALFTLLGMLWMLQLLPLRWLPHNRKEAAGSEAAVAVPATAARQSSGTFWLLLAAQILLSISGFAMIMGRTLLMDVEGFTPTTVTVTAAVGSAGAIFMNPLVGRLSDRVDRQLLLLAGYALLALSLALLAGASSAIVFLLISLLTAAGNAGRVVEPALVTDVVPAALLDSRMSLFGAAGWAGGVIGLAGTGYAVEWIGLRPALLAATLLPMAGVLLLGAAGYRRRTRSRRAALATVPEAC
jgi:AAHS family 4-hydroxybenzoate transporter-like MFS transporter